MLLLLSLLTLSPARAATRFVQDVMLIGGTKTEVLMKVITYVRQGWSVIEQDLNDGCGSDSEYIYLLYKNDDYGGGFNYGSITGFYIYSWNGTKKLPPDTKTIGGRTYYLVPYTGGADFVEGKGDLNEGPAAHQTISTFITPAIPFRTVVSSPAFPSTLHSPVPWVRMEAPLAMT